MNPVTWCHLMFWLLVAHALCDFPLQNDYLSRAKNAWGGAPEWPWCLGAHALIQGGGVAYVTDSIVLGVAEVVMHALIDYAKCGKAITYSQDQAAHIGCKVLWLALLSTCPGLP